MKISELVQKYGPAVTATIPPQAILGTGNVYFVDSGATNALDANDGEHGNSWDQPFATLNYAISRCTASQGDVILLAPGHAETIQDQGIASGTTTDEVTVDKAGVSILGLGTGSIRPTFTLSGATDATINVIAPNVTIDNIVVVSGLEDTAAGITGSALCDGLTISNCEIKDGGTAILELVAGVTIAALAYDVTIEGCRFITTVAGSSTASAIVFEGINSRYVVRNNLISGDWNTAAIANTAGISTDILIENNYIYNIDAGAGLAISLHNSCNGAVVRNLMHGGKDGTAPIAAAGCLVAENYGTNAEGASGIILPAVDS